MEVSCFSFLTAQALWVLEILRLEEYDTIDINVYIILEEKPTGKNRPLIQRCVKFPLLS